MRKTDESQQLQRRAEQVIPGGVDSPVRAFKSVGGEPVLWNQSVSAFMRARF